MMKIMVNVCAVNAAVLVENHCYISEIMTRRKDCDIREINDSLTRVSSRFRQAALQLSS